ncbi:Protein of unknown function (DUF4240) [Parafrankia irregularis]|uniref:DUF4240 domain-containing protein n=1 Tax=Parafrankia irregularis TaxID=795642 RepID=A0A0S4R205_9ACTN|nr:MULTISPECIES: DUF4240 domain-containing protein [Parafrankia]MBE3205747.1 DUF4240 domain-containing protein [Parafrankia sp. CH37]CUU61244.1 Protein of unknown function (DUF4240) [Parafrankia irregularis]
MADFWQIIGESRARDASDLESALDRLSAQLNGLSPAELMHFAEQLRESLYYLDRREIAEIPVRVPGGLKFPQTSDHFLYARCACVLAGEDAYNAALQYGAEFERFVKPFVQEAEGLLYLASDLYEEKTGRKMEVGRNFPIESMSNVQGWSG